MAGELILLTGATGHVGYHVLTEALSKGYKVRAAVRSEAKSDAIKAAKQTQPYLNNLTFTIVPDIQKEGAYDEAVKGVDYVVHIASPLSRPSDNPEETIIQPAINATVGILHSAIREPAIKKVVITSSVAAISPAKPSSPFIADNVVPDPQPPYPNDFAAYTASKQFALNRTRDFIANQKPHFDVINVMPTFIIGPQGLATTKEGVLDGTNRLIFGPLTGVTNPAPFPAMVCHTDDVAFVHIAALDPKVKGNLNFGVNNSLTNPPQWDDAIEIVKKNFPHEVATGMFPLGGSTKSIPIPFDASKTEEFFGIKFKSYEDMVKDTVRQYLGVAGAA